MSNEWIVPPTNEAGAVGLEQWSHKTTGPCSKCGCAMLISFGRQEINGAIWENVTCRHCGNEFRRPVESSVILEVRAARAGCKTDEIATIRYAVNRCPYCQSANTTVKRTIGGRRRHMCGDCRKPFNSLE